jgi:23S rRNA (uracil1939-C5)-methyltransferase
MHECEEFTQACPSATSNFVCPHVDSCAGCPQLASDYDEQLSFKQQRVRDAVSHYPDLATLSIDPVIPSEPPSAYRTRAKLMVGFNGEIGLYDRQGTHRIVDIPGCIVLSLVISKALVAVRALLADGSLGIAPGRVLQALDLREAVDAHSEKLLLTLVIRRDLAPSTDELRHAARLLLSHVEGLAGVAANLREADGPRVLGAETIALAGQSIVRDRIGPTFHLATFGAFVQVNRKQALRVHELIAEGLDSIVGKVENARVLELYGGSGSIGLHLAYRGARVQMVESFAPAVEQANRAAQEQSLAGRFSAQCGDAFHEGRRFVESADKSMDLVIVNPPRRGLSPEVREFLARAKPRAIAYISCDPDTLARDLDHMARLGWRPSRLRPLDMIPLTEEVETFAWLEPSSPPPARVLYQDDEIIVVDKDPHEPTTPERDYVGSLSQRVRAIEGVDNCVPVRRMDVGVSGICFFARSAQLAVAWVEALAQARFVYMVGCKGITPSKGTITRDLREQGRPVTARTRSRRLAIVAGHSVIRAIPEQAYPHQVSRHLSAVGHPILGDERNGHSPSNRYFEEKHSLDRPFLHCVRVEAVHPTTQCRLVIDAQLAGDLKTVLLRAGGPSTLRFLDHKHALGSFGFSSIPPGPSDEVIESQIPSSRELRQSVPSFRDLEPLVPSSRDFDDKSGSS